LGRQRRASAWKDFGKFSAEVEMKRSAVVCDCGDHAFLALTRGMSCLVDCADVPVISGLNWNTRQCGRWHQYAGCEREGRTELMHRVLMCPSPGQVVDHINGDTLDNRRRNLRVCAVGENLRNSRGKRGRHLPKGVYERQGRYDAKIMLAGVRHFLGAFASAEEAAAAYSAASQRLHGDFGRAGL
jgi:hypothetical protein